MSLRRNGFATVAGGTPTVLTVTSVDLSMVQPEMTVHFGSNLKVQGDGYIITSVTPTGTSGGTIEVAVAAPVGTNQPIIIDTRAYNGAHDGLVAASAMRLFNSLEELMGVGTSLAGNKQIYLTKGGTNALAEIRFRQVVGSAVQDFFKIHQAVKGGFESLIFSRSADGSTWADVFWLRRDTDAVQFGNVSFSGTLSTVASSTSFAGIRIPQGVAPVAPVNGDVWSTASGWFAHNSDVTQQFAMLGLTYPTLILNKPVSGQYSGILAQKAGSNRWLIMLGDATAESGVGNAGSDFALYAYSDAGTQLRAADIQISRATGRVTLGSGLQTNASGNAFRFSHANPAYYGTLGTTGSGAIPFLAFHAELNAIETFKNSGAGIRGSVFTWDGTNLLFRVNGVTTADADFSSMVTALTVSANGDVTAGSFTPAANTIPTLRNVSGHTQLNAPSGIGSPNLLLGPADVYLRAVTNIYFQNLAGTVSALELNAATGVATFPGQTHVSNTTVSTSTTTGALRVSGGVGIAGNLYGATAFFGDAPQFVSTAFNSGVAGTSAWAGWFRTHSYGIGISSSQTSFNAALFYVEGQGGSPSGSITVIGPNTSYNEVSDGRRKPVESRKPLKNVRAMIDGVEIIEHGWDMGDSRQIGAIAQDVYKVKGAKQIITKGDDDPNKRPGDEGFQQWMADWSRGVPITWAAVQELYKEQDKLRAELAELKKALKAKEKK